MHLWPKLCQSLGKEEDIHRTLTVLTYQFGDLHKYIFYSEKYPEYKVAYRGEIKAALADMIAQTELLCERLGIGFDEMRTLGHMRFLKSDEKERRE